ncbi:hypothetical protein MKX01_019190 [Papaver californicum]|nr:hypothetical protein MKX01_019190 [Papaver californicum]
MSETAAMIGRSERRRPPSPKVAPWLVIPYGKGMKNQAFYNLCEPDNRTCRKLIPELSGKSFYQKPSHQGWLIVLCDVAKIDYTPGWNFEDCFLWNPATFENIQLPSKLSSSSGYTYNDYLLVDCVLSSPPKTDITNTNPDDSMVFFLFERCDNDLDYVFLFCRPGDKQWRTHKFSRDENIITQDILSIHYFKGELYAMSSYALSNYKIKIKKIDDDDDSVNLCIGLFQTSNDTDFPSIGGILTSCHTTIYVQTIDEFYMLELEFTSEGEEVISVNIARLDFSCMGWKEVNDLGDNVLFFGENTIACCSAAELGLTKGCLYYTRANSQSLYKFELGGTGTIILPCLKLPTPWFSSGWIMMPATFRIGDRQVITESTLQRRKEEEEEEEEEEEHIADPKVVFTSSGYNDGEVNQPWSILNADTLRLLASYLHPFDYKEFRSACKANRCILPVVKQTSTSNRILNSTYVSPCLVYLSMDDCPVYNFVDPMHNNENYLMKLPLLGGARIRFQKGGWLLMSEGPCRFFFHNPFTKETIELPDFPSCCDFSNISFSSLPTCSDCVVSGIRVMNMSSIRVYLIARGENSWRFREFDNINLEYYKSLLNTPALHKGTFYRLDYNGLLGAFNLEDGISWSYKVLAKPRKLFGRAYPSFLVECGGDLILVKLGHNGTLVGVFRLDFSRMEWVSIKSLGKHMLFVSYTSCISRIAPNSGMENKIYFPRLSLHGEGILYYSLDTGRYHSLGSRHTGKDFSDSKGWASWSWIEPNWSRSTVQELDWTVTLL